LQAVGWDFHSVETKIIEAHGRAIIRTDIGFHFPNNVYGEIWGRSGLAKNYGITVGGGLIDTDFTGDVRVLIFNHDATDYLVRRGDRIAQIVFKQCIPIRLRTISKVSITEHGHKGFGSTGR